MCFTRKKHRKNSNKDNVSIFTIAFGIENEANYDFLKALSLELVRRNMNITYDKDADCLYIQFQQGKVQKTKKIEEGIMAIIKKSQVCVYLSSQKLSGILKPAIIAMRNLK